MTPHFVREPAVRRLVRQRLAAAGALGILLMLTLAACGSGATSAATLATAEPNSPRITARDVHFDRSELSVPSGRPFTLVFENADGAPHNVAIYTDPSAATLLFRSDVFGGPATRAYAVPALPAGSYFFRCDVHLDMLGTLTASPG
jgi:plastocyanin